MSMQVSLKFLSLTTGNDNNLNQNSTSPKNSAVKTHATVVGNSKKASSVNTSNPFAQISSYQQAWLAWTRNTFLQLQSFAIDQCRNVKSLFEEVEDPLYLQAQSDATFTKYEHWYRSAPRSFFRSCARELGQGIPAADFHMRVLEYWQAVQNEGTPSPLSYAVEVERLTDVIAEMELSQNYQNALDEVLVQLSLALKTQRHIVPLFIRDISYLIILLSGGEINGNLLLKSLSVYKNVLREENYQTITKLLGDFIKKYKLEEFNRESQFTSKIQNRVYRELFKTLQASLMTNVERKNIHPRYYKETRAGFKPHPYLALTMVAVLLGGHSYAQAQNYVALDGRNGYVINGIIPNDYPGEIVDDYSPASAFPSSTPFPTSLPDDIDDVCDFIEDDSGDIVDEHSLAAGKSYVIDYSHNMPSWVNFDVKKLNGANGFKVYTINREGDGIPDLLIVRSDDPDEIDKK